MTVNDENIRGVRLAVFFICHTTTQLLTHKRRIRYNTTTPNGLSVIQLNSRGRYLAPQIVSGKDYMSALHRPRKGKYHQLLAKTLINSYILHSHLIVIYLI